MKIGQYLAIFMLGTNLNVISKSIVSPFFDSRCRIISLHFRRWLCASTFICVADSKTHTFWNRLL